MRYVFVSHNGETELLVESLHFLGILILVHNGDGLFGLEVVERIHQSSIVSWIHLALLIARLAQLCIKHLNSVCTDVSAIVTTSVGAKLRI